MNGTRSGWMTLYAASDSARVGSTSTCGINNPALTSFSYRPDSINRAYSFSYLPLTCRYSTPLTENRNPLGSLNEAESCPLVDCVVIVLISLRFFAEPSPDLAPRGAQGNAQAKQCSDQ